MTDYPSASMCMLNQSYRRRKADRTALLAEQIAAAPLSPVAVKKEEKKELSQVWLVGQPFDHFRICTYIRIDV
jgi:hypothetical protein